MFKMLSVAAIKEGTVIDHIPAGQGLAIVKLLHLTLRHDRLLIGLNLPSSSMETKDLIKIENGFLTEEEKGSIAIFAKGASLVTIKDYQVISKQPALLPKTLVGIFPCLNIRCITHQEKIPSRFTIDQTGEKVHLRCDFCEQLFERKRF